MGSCELRRGYDAEGHTVDLGSGFDINGEGFDGGISEKPDDDHLGRVDESLKTNGDNDGSDGIIYAVIRYEEDSQEDLRVRTAVSANRFMRPSLIV